MTPKARDLPPDVPRLLQSLLQALPGAAFRCLNDERWTLLYLSAGGQRLFGRDPGATGAGLLEFLGDEDRKLLRQRAAELAADGEGLVQEVRLQQSDGSQRWALVRAQLVRDRVRKQWLLEGFCEDVTDWRHEVNALREAEARYKDIFNNTADGVFRSTPEGRLLVVNPAMARIFGYESPAQMVRDIRDLSEQYVEPGNRAELKARLDEHGAVRNSEFQMFRRRGEVIWVSINAHVVRGADGAIEFYEGTMADITERRIYQAQVERQASYDALTGLANRARLNTRLEQSIRACEGSGAQLAVAFIDLDQFKHINDSYGHQLGDALLLTVAERLKAAVRGQDLVARLGGDEFVLLLLGFNSQQELERIVQRVHRAVSQPWQAQKREFNVSCSMGVAVYPQDGRNADVLMRNADAAMYCAKECGRNNHQYFTGELNRRLMERLDVEHRLRDALPRKELLLQYQSRVDARSGRVVGAEALLRWQPPGSALVPPDRFIGVAEDSGLIVPIGRWVLQTACRQAAEWLSSGLPPVVMSVNVSPRQFRQDDVVAAIERALESSRLSPGLLQIELTEGLSMHDADKFITTLSDIKRLGVQIAVDDFGTGYSSLNYLKRFPVDHLKVDRSFVADLVDDPDDAAIVQAIIALGHKLGLKVVAEGVENQAQLEFLRRCACDEMQGFLFGKPVSAEEFAAVLIEQERQTGVMRQLA